MILCGYFFARGISDVEKDAFFAGLLSSLALLFLPVKTAHPSGSILSHEVISDPCFDKRFHLHYDGAFGFPDAYTVDVDVDAKEAWSLATTTQGWDD
jgi:hypothetical protein